MQGNDIQSSTNRGLLRQWVQVHRIKWVMVFMALLLVAYGAHYFTTPHYKGRTVAYWYNTLWTFNPETSNEALAAFKTMGAEAVPFLMKEMEPRPSKLKAQLNGMLVHFFPWVRTYDQQLNDRIAHASYLLGQLSESSRPAIPLLQKAASHSMWYVASAATAALIKIRKEPLDPYIERLKDRRDGTKWYPNAMILADLGTNASAAVPLLLESLQYPDGIIQAHALIALGSIQSEPQRCVPAIIPFLTNPEVAIRQKAFFAVSQFKTNASSASKEIIKGLSDSDQYTRYMALLAVKEVLTPPAQKRALPQAEALLKDPDPYVRKNAKKLVPQIRSSASQ